MMFGNNESDIEQLLSELRVRNFPKVVLLIGCETSSCDAYAGTAANSFLARGSIAAVSTLLPVQADLAGYFVGRLIYNIKNVEGRRFGELVHATKNGMWINEQTEALLRSGKITTKDYLRLWDSYRTDPQLASFDFAEYGANFKIREGFCDILRSRDLYQAWLDLKDAVTPHSLFFSLMGLGHSLRIGVR